MIGELVGKVFADRSTAHVVHWATGSYAEHMALGAFYEGAIVAVDALVENYIGMFGKFKPVLSEENGNSDMKDRLQDTADWIESNRDEIAQDSAHIGNLVDNLTAVYTKAIYMLGMK